jgi:predicted RecA/RadA family phage recombinase
MSEAATVQSGEVINVTAIATRTKGEVVVAPDGRAGIVLQDAVIGNPVGVDVTDGAVYDVPKTALVVLLAGQEVYWDASANSATYWATDDKDFCLGVVVKDAAGTDTTVRVALNREPECVFDAAEDPARSIMVRTAGLADLFHAGGSTVATFSATAEAQKMDLISVRSVPIASKWIFQAVGCVLVDASADVGDLSFGMADATHATDADAIVTSAFFHLNLSGADLKIYAESDNAAAEVAATDTTKVYVVGTPFHLMIDGRSGDGTALKYYVNGIRVLSSTVFTVAGAVGPLKALFHFEKSSNASLGSVALDNMRLWLQDDAAA